MVSRIDLWIPHFSTTMQCIVLHPTYLKKQASNPQSAPARSLSSNSQLNLAPQLHAFPRRDDRPLRAPTKGAHLHERDEELARGVADGLLAVAEALDGGGDEGVEVDLEVVAGDDGGDGERLEAALGDAEVGVPRQIHAGVHQRGDLGRRQPAPRRQAPRAAARPRPDAPWCPWPDLMRRERGSDRERTQRDESETNHRPWFEHHPQSIPSARACGRRKWLRGGMRRSVSIHLA